MDVTPLDRSQNIEDPLGPDEGAIFRSIWPMCTSMGWARDWHGVSLALEST